MLAVPNLVPAADDLRSRAELPAVEVLGTVPLPGMAVPIEQVPANIQTGTAQDIAGRQALDLPELLERAFDGVNLNATQGNPFQMDVNFRGYSASPLLGTPQGISVFVDGVRVNESFGDTVNWDLIPRIAIDRVALLPGSNPVFGLNTLGGALVIHTKSGFEHPGYGLRVSGGSFGRLGVEAEYGLRRDRVGYFVAVNELQETGWREHSRSDVRQLFAKGALRDGATRADLSFSFADNTLNGIQALPVSMLSSPRQAYTWPDTTTNALASVNATGTRALSGSALVSGNVYARRVRSRGSFSNVNDAFDPAAPLAIGNSPAFNNVNELKQDRYGAGLQLSLATRPRGRDNQLTVGFSFESGRSTFVNQQQEAVFTAERSTVATAPIVPITSASARNRYIGMYFSNVLAVNQYLHMTLSGRYNRADVDISDDSGVTRALNGSHAFQRFNPGIGFTLNPGKGVTAYASYYSSMRAATPAELTCADPSAPCRLPNAFLADPPLSAVTAHTLEAGFRIAMFPGVRLRGAVYSSTLRNDIQFVAATRAVNAGFFQNVGETRRQGAELGAEAHAATFRVSASYAYIDATYRSPFAEPSPNNSSAVDTDGDGVPDTIQVRPGSRIPGIPRRTFKLRIEQHSAESLVWGISMISTSRQFARGDENNADASGSVPGYVVWHADGRYRFASGWSVLAKADNLFNRRYATFGGLGANFFRGPGSTFTAADAAPEQFRTPAAARALWLALEYRIAQRDDR